MTQKSAAATSRPPDWESRLLTAGHYSAGKTFW